MLQMRRTRRGSFRLTWPSVLQSRLSGGGYRPRAPRRCATASSTAALPAIVAAAPAIRTRGRGSPWRRARAEAALRSASGDALRVLFGVDAFLRARRMPSVRSGGLPFRRTARGVEVRKCEKDRREEAWQHIRGARAPPARSAASAETADAGTCVGAR
eukprot:364988-Chlamydomonas_euryale.AAC.13